MKILHVISTMNPDFGGPVENIKLYCRKYQKFKSTGEVICSDSPFSMWRSKKNLPRVYFLGPGYFNYSLNLNLDKWLNRNLNKYDFVIINGLWQYHSYATYKACIKFKKPYFVFTHGMLDPYFNKENPIKLIKKYVYWFLFERHVIKNANKVLFTTREEKKLARLSFKPYKCNEKFIGYGIEGIKKKLKKNKKNKKNFLNKYNLNNKKYLLYLGRFHKKKGINLLIEAFRKSIKNNKNLYLVLSGPKNKYFSKEILTQIKKYDIKNNIIITGALRNDLKWQALTNSLALCLTSHQENFGIVIAESLSCGKPVLITDQVNTFKTVKKYNAGIVSKNNVKSITGMLEKFLGVDKKKYNKYCANAKKCFIENYKIDKPVQNLLKLIKKEL